MPQKRDVLQHLTRDELVSVVNRFDLSPKDRRAKDGLVEAIAASKKATLPEILPELPRDRLKELCQAFDLDDGGREKGALVERLVGGKIEPTPSSKKSNGYATNGASTKLAESIEVVPGEKLTVERLERDLLAGADILRGSIDSSDYKNYIFGLLFLKRLSDRFDEECEALVKDGDDPEDKDNHQFFVPKRARWQEIQKVATDLGSALNKACSQLEEVNGSLEGVLAGIDYNDERKLGDAKNRDAVLGRLVQHFSRLSLKNGDLSEPDMLGRAYEYLIEHFADDAGKKGGEFYTPRMVVRLLVEMLAPTEKMRICDPTAGSGGMLIECAHYLERHKQNPKDLSLYGQEKNLGTWAICKMNMLLHGLPDARIEKGDTIDDPKLLEGGSLMLFDRVIANPPFSDKQWKRSFALTDPWSRFSFGVPSQRYGDLAYTQHMLSTLKRDGMLAVIMPHGVLFRPGVEREIRTRFIESDLLDSVVVLPPNLFYGASLPAVVLVLSRKKPESRRGTVLFIDASRDYREGTNQNYLRLEDVEKIVSTFGSRANIDAYSRVIANDEIRSKNYNLSISRYLTGSAASARRPVDDDVRALRAALASRSEAERLVEATLARVQTADEEFLTGWSERSVGSLGQWLSGGTPSKANASLWTGSLPWVSPKDMKVTRISDAIDHVAEAAVGRGTQRVGAGAILIVVRGMILAHSVPVALTTAAVTFNQDIKALVPADDVSPEFVLYTLEDSKDEILRFVDTATHGTKRIPTEQLFEFPVLLPDRAEQEKIGEAIAAVDEAIEANRRAASALGTLKKSLAGALLAGEARLVSNGSAEQ